MESTSKTFYRYQYNEHYFCDFLLRFFSTFVSAHRILCRLPKVNNLPIASVCSGTEVIVFFATYSTAFLSVKGYLSKSFVGIRSGTHYVAQSAYQALFNGKFMHYCVFFQFISIFIRVKKDSLKPLSTSGSTISTFLNNFEWTIF